MSKGFTLVEALLSMAILTIVLLGVYGVLKTGNTVIFNDAVRVELQQQARNAMDRLVREVRQASSHIVTTINANHDRLTVTIPSASNILFYLSGTNFVREYPAGTIKTLASDISYLKFSTSGSVLTINVRASKTQYNRTITVPLMEKVRLRNE